MLARRRHDIGRAIHGRRASAPPPAASATRATRRPAFGVKRRAAGSDRDIGTRLLERDGVALSIGLFVGFLALVIVFLALAVLAAVLHSWFAQ